MKGKLLVVEVTERERRRGWVTTGRAMEVLQGRVTHPDTLRRWARENRIARLAPGKYRLEREQPGSPAGVLDILFDEAPGNDAGIGA